MSKEKKYSNAGKGDKNRVSDKRNSITTTKRYLNQSLQLSRMEWD